MTMEKNKPRKGLPAEARLVFKGVIFEVWQWDQKMFDGTVKVFEKIWRVPTVEVIATMDGKILIEEQDQPDRPDNINMVSGRADMDEDPLVEAKRELLEETGCESKDWTLFRTESPSGKVMHETYYFIARNCAKVKEPELDAGEKIGVKLISFEDFIMLSEEPRFWASPNFISYLRQLQHDPKKKEEFRKLIFPS